MNVFVKAFRNKQINLTNSDSPTVGPVQSFQFFIIKLSIQSLQIQSCKYFSFKNPGKKLANALYWVGIWPSDAFLSVYELHVFLKIFLWKLCCCLLLCFIFIKLSDVSHQNWIIGILQFIFSSAACQPPCLMIN